MRSTRRIVRALVVPAAVLAALLPATRVEAQSYTLDFFGFVCCTYGSVPGVVDVSYAHRSGWGNAAITSTFAYPYRGAYNDLLDVIYVDCCQGVGEITLDNLLSGRVTLNAADVGAYPYRDADVALQVYDGFWNLLYSGVGVTIGATTHAHFAPGVFDADLLHVQWSAIDAQGSPIDAFNTGLDNVDFTIAAAPSAVPEPATVALLATGLLAVGGIARRRARAA